MTATALARGLNAARAFKVKDAFGQPKPVLAAMPQDADKLPIEGTAVKVGSVFGTATKAVQVTRQKPNGDTESWNALDGNFEAIPTNEAMPITRAPRCFLPDHLHQMIADQLADETDADGVVTKPGASNVGFAFDVLVVAKKSSSTGFVWQYQAKADFATVDPLAALRALVLPAPETAAQIEAPKAPAKK